MPLTCVFYMYIYLYIIVIHVNIKSSKLNHVIFGKTLLKAKKSVNSVKKEKSKKHGKN